MLLRHPRADIALLTAERNAGKAIREVFPQFSPFDLPKLVAIEGLDRAAAGLDVAFCALPHATTQKVIKELLAKSPATKVVDLSADFRLADAAAYEKWYGHAHHAPELQKEAVYGLCEIHRRDIKKARLVANPGCYTSCAELPADPADQGQGHQSRRDRGRTSHQSAWAGGGRAAREAMLFSEVSEGFNAYGVGGHRHMAELNQEFSAAAGREVVVTFTPHLVPINRGILSTIYVRGRRGRTPEDLHAILLKFYAKEPFVMCCRLAKRRTPGTCAGSNMTFIGVAKDRIPGRAIVVSALDNLVKGASGQAIQNMNLGHGLHGNPGARTGGAVSVSCHSRTAR